MFSHFNEIITKIFFKYYGGKSRIKIFFNTILYFDVEIFVLYFYVPKA